MRTIVLPTKEARKEILKVFRGQNEHTNNAIFINMWTGEVHCYAYYRSDKGEYIASNPKDCYVLHVNKFNPFISYQELDEIIIAQLDILREALNHEISFMKKEYGRKMNYDESPSEFKQQQEYMRVRLEELEEI